MDKPEEPIHQRLNLLIHALEEGVQRRFALKVGIAAGVVNDILGVRKSKPGFEIISKILQAYQQVRAEWLMRGEGEMLKSTAPTDSPQKNSLYKAPPPEGLIAPPGQGENSTSESIVREEATPLLPSQRPMLTYTNIKNIVVPSPATEEVVGMDLLRQVAENTAAIKELREHMAKLSQHPTFRT